ncbi:MAG: type III-B CRISPR module-associated protein Cmr5 [Bacteroidales bacterium]|nr:type III-B CRISPR module-associated protein Cmr5 [Bacteroidales bacterium]
MQNEKPLQNYEQIRAKHAYDDKDSICIGKDGGRAGAKKFPAIIVSNGFLGALAFAADSGEGLATVAFSVVNHLDQGGFLPNGKNFGMKSTLDELKSTLEEKKRLSVEDFKKKISRIIDKDGTPKLDSFIRWLASESSATLRVLTAEALAYLNFLRRFASPGDEQ